ncbi:TadE/TadG family type IV pilus assembly protein [Shinella sp.]|uniref:TadE/TadG family type IV pilus assembly protein n=1 Tax=Shinella sp. TaxID=1870904 RepID=UPI0029A05255|nr:TadE/TadG family type IV pilus assembly protein [Shinella sp.]MDX3977326.1 pilus assembly protein [Shinella sp.]
MSLDHDAPTRRRPMKGLLGRLFARRDGATAMEFALLSLPFFMIVFASLETFVAFSAEQMLANATDTMARKIRMGDIRSTTKDGEKNAEAVFRKAFCDEIAILMPCSTAELAKPDKLYLDVRSFATYADIPKAVPMIGTDLDTSAFKFAPGGKRSINIIRAYYRWDIVTDVVRPYVSNIRASDGSRQNYLMVATAVVQNEDFP